MATIIQFPQQRVRTAGQATTPAPVQTPASVIDDSAAWKTIGVIFAGLLVVEGVRYWAGLDTEPVFLPRSAGSRIARR